MTYLVDFVLSGVLVVFVVEIDTLAWRRIGYLATIYPFTAKYGYWNWQAFAVNLDIIAYDDTLRIKPIGMFAYLV